MKVFTTAVWTIQRSQHPKTLWRADTAKNDPREKKWLASRSALPQRSPSTSHAYPPVLPHPPTGASSFYVGVTHPCFRVTGLRNGAQRLISLYVASHKNTPNDLLL
jgi:hypothetical protein